MRVLYIIFSHWDKHVSNCRPWSDPGEGVNGGMAPCKKHFAPLASIAIFIITLMPLNGTGKLSYDDSIPFKSAIWHSPNSTAVSAFPVVQPWSPVVKLPVRLISNNRR